MSGEKQIAGLSLLGIQFRIPRLILCLFSVAGALAIFFVVSSEQIVGVLRYSAFFLSALSSIVAIYCLCRLLISYLRKQGLQKIAKAFLPALIGSALVFLHADFDHKVAMDDYILSSSAKMLYENQQYIVPLSGQWTDESYFVSEAYFDKRPWFYSFSVSVAHFLTGWRVENAFYMNALFGLAFIVTLCGFGRKLAGLHGAWLSVLLAASLPLLAQSATGGGMDMANLFLLALLVFLGAGYLQEPNSRLEGALAAVLVCLVYTRYESIVYAVPVALVIVLGWWRTKQAFISIPLLLTLPMLVWSLLQSRYFRGSEVLLELHGGATSQFGLEHIPDNLSRATYFFFNLSDTLANSAILSLIGVIFLVALFVFGLTRFTQIWKEYPGIFATGIFVCAIVANFFVLMAYHDGKLDRIFASRLSLPIYLAFILATISAIRLIQPFLVIQRFLILFTVLYLVGWSIPANARELFSKRNYVHNELDWLIHEVGPDIWERDLIVDEKSVAWALEEKQVLRPLVFLQEIETITERLASGDYENIYLVERMEIGVVNGEVSRAPSRYPEGVLEKDVLLRRSFRPFSVMQVSRVTAIHPDRMPGDFFENLEPFGQRQDYGYDGL